MRSGFENRPLCHDLYIQSRDQVFREKQIVVKDTKNSVKRAGDVASARKDPSESCAGRQESRHYVI